ncbi:MAG TPA: iron-containing alcohol dehydrogenase [Ktedonobacterales bacterium]
MEQFHYTSYAQDIIFGQGTLSQAGALAERFAWRRLMLCATAGASGRGALAPIEAALGERLALTYARVRPHVPEAEVAEATDLAERHAIDAIIGFGGGSAIGAAKAVSLALDGRHTGLPARSTTPMTQPVVPVLAIPTTYAGSEMTPTYGVTRLIDGVSQKVTVTDIRVTPKAVIYDPLLTLELPARETAGTGVNAIAHCVEALYSITRNPLSTATALAGLRALNHALPACLENSAAVAARDETLTGAHLAGMALAHVAMGLHHGICHVIGGATGAAHGDINAIMLPHVLRFNLDVCAPQLALAADALGVSAAGRDAPAIAQDVTQHITVLIERTPLPRRLRDLDIGERGLSELARLAFASRTVRNNPKPITDAAQIDTLLRAAW